MAEIKNLSLIKEVDLFKDLSDDELSRILYMAFVKDYETDLLLFNEGQEGNVMFIILSGEVQLFKKDKNNENKLILTLKDSEFFGEMSLIENQARSTSARISKPTKMLVITKRAFQNMLDADPHITSKLLMKFLKILSERLRKTTSKYFQGN